MYLSSIKVYISLIANLSYQSNLYIHYSLHHLHISNVWHKEYMTCSFSLNYIWWYKTLESLKWVANRVLISFDPCITKHSNTFLMYFSVIGAIFLFLNLYKSPCSIFYYNSKVFHFKLSPKFNFQPINLKYVFIVIN